MVEVSLEGWEPMFKHVNTTVRLENKGAGEAFNTILEFSGDVEPLRIDVGSISAGGGWSKTVTLRLKSALANIRARATFFDASGNKYVSEGFATVVSPNYVVPEHFEEYTLRVPEHFEKRRVFVPGYEGYTHVKIYHPYSAFEIPGSFTIGFEGIILEAEGVKVYTSFLPIADEGFELRVIPKNLTLNIYGDVLVGPLIPVQGLQTTVPVKYVVTSVEPAFEEKLVREDEARSIFNVTGCGEIKAPEGYEVTLASKRVVRKPVWVDTSTYWRLQQEGFGRIREGCYWYEDGYREEWPSSDVVCESTPFEREVFANRIVLVYHPLQEVATGSLARGLWLRNYATQDIDYTITVEPVTLPPSKPETARLKAGKASCKELSLLLFSNTTFWVRLRKDDRLVAELFLQRVVSLPPLVSLQWWRGFSLGIIERSPRIAVNIMMLNFVAMVPSELMPVIGVTLGILKGIQVFNQRGELFNATMALKNLTAMGLIYRGMADGYRLQNKDGFAAVCQSLSEAFLSRAREVAEDLGLRLVLDVSLEDFKTALGWRRASEFEQGYAAGRIVGAIFEAVTYAATYAAIYHEVSTARDALNAAGGAGEFSAAEVLKRFGKGLYAWVTPAIWDLAELGIKGAAWLKGRLSLEDISKLILADRVSKEFGETVGKALETLPDGGVNIAKATSEIFSEVTMDKEVPKAVGESMLRILAKAGEGYAGRGDWDGKMLDAAETIVEAWKSVEGLEAWGEGEEPGRLLEWLEKIKPDETDEAVKTLKGFATLSDEELEGLGEALARVGDSFEDGLKLFKTYVGLEFYPSSAKVKSCFLNQVEEYGIKAIEKWSQVLEYSNKHGVLGVPALIEELKIGREVRKYPVVSGDIVEVLGLKPEENIVTLFVEKGGETYRILGEYGEPKKIEDSTVYPILPQEDLRREGRRFTDLFNLKTGDFVAVFKGAVEPDFFFTTEKAAGEKVKVKLTGIWGEKFIEANGYGDYFVYYRRIDEQSLHHAMKEFGETKEGNYITLMSHGEGTYILRIKAVTWDAFSDIMSEVAKKIPIDYGSDPSTGKGRITVKIKDTRGKLRDTSISAVYEYVPYLKVGDIEGGMKWDLQLGEAGGQMKALRIGVAIDDMGALHYDIEYSPDYDPENLGGTHWFEAKKAEYVERPFGTVMKIEHEGGARYLLFDSSSGTFRGEYIGPRDSEYRAISEYFRNVLSRLEIPKPSYDKGDKTWKLEIATSKEFAEAWAYVDSLLTTQGKGAIATEAIRDLLLKAYPEYFGITDTSKIVVDMTGQNLRDYVFDIMGGDLEKKTLFFVGEAESVWEKWNPDSLLDRATKDLSNHFEVADGRGFKLPDKGYVFAVHLLRGEIEIWWKEVKP